MHKARKRFGQNFLHDERVIHKIIRSINPQKSDLMVEIGPGQGALTEELLAGCDGHLHVVELDRDLIPILRTKFFSATDLQIHESDALKFDFSELTEKGQLRVVGNLPYNISTPLMFHLISFGTLIKDMHFMLQKEVVERICAEPGNSAFGRLTVMMQYHCEAENLFTVGPEAFNPAPKVESAIIRLVPRHSHKIKVNNDLHFSDFVRQSFGQRRKTLRNNLKGWLTAEQIEAAGIDPGVRPERVSVDQFVTLTNIYSETQTSD